MSVSCAIAFSVRCVLVDFVGFMFVVVVVEDEGFGDDGGVGLLLIVVVGRGVFNEGEREGEGDLFRASLRGGGNGVGEGFGGEV